VATRSRGGLTADHVLRQRVHLYTACIPVVCNLVPLGRLPQVLPQMAQPVVAPIQRLDALSGQVAQGMVHALEGGVPRPFPVVAFRDDRGHSHLTAVHPPLSPRCVQWRGRGRPKTSGKPILTSGPRRSATSSTRSVKMTSARFPRRSWTCWARCTLTMLSSLKIEPRGREHSTCIARFENTIGLNLRKSSGN